VRTSACPILKESDLLLK